MKGWNAVIRVYQGGFRRAMRALKECGPVERSPYHNVFVMRVEDPIALREAIERKTDTNTALYDAISRVAPAMRTIDFHRRGPPRQSADTVRVDPNQIEQCIWELDFRSAPELCRARRFS